MTNLLRKIPTFSGITCDSRKVKPGDAFVAITGYKEDGNQYIKEAINNGATVIFTEKKITSDRVKIIKVNDSRAFLGKLAAKYYNYPSKKLNLIGVTGTNGKTTTTHLIYNLLNYNYKQSGLIGTVMVDSGKEISPGNLTTPSPVLLQKILNNMVTNHLKFGCMEVSSHGIKLKRIAGTEFAVKVGTNITKDHFDLHPNFEEYKKVKKSFLLENNQDTLVLINNDDPHLVKMGQLTNKQFNFGIDKPSAIQATDIKSKGLKTSFSYCLEKPIKQKETVINPCQFPIEMSLPGKHNIYNALVAITIGLYYDLDPELIQAFFNNFRGIWRRLQIIYKDKFTIIDDCAHNPGSYQAVFQATEKINFNKLYIVNSLRGNRGIKINEENALTLINQLHKFNNYDLYTTNCTDVVKEIDKVSNEEEKRFLLTLNKAKLNYTHFQQLRPALKRVMEKINEGDLVLLLGPHSMDKAGDMILTMI